jgi:hypothetical protein
MTTQLTLLPADSALWQLDDHTRAVGREGLAQARRALAELRTYDPRTFEPRTFEPRTFEPQAFGEPVATTESPIDLVARAA